jgi:hypothetical protein
MKKYTWIRRTFLGGLVLALATGCASLDQPYIPAKMGNLNDSLARGGIEISLVPDRYLADIGDMLAFSIILKNVSAEPIWIPREPDMLMTWVYPDGKRDNVIRDAKPVEYTKANSTLLNPGDEKVYRSAVTTYYFNRGGITEFRALVSANHPVRDGLGPYWTGEAESNGFGVMMRD